MSNFLLQELKKKLTLMNSSSNTLNEDRKRISACISAGT